MLFIAYHAISNGTSQAVGEITERRREAERQQVLAQYNGGARGGERPVVPFGKYQGMDALDLACVRSVLAAQQRDPGDADSRSLEAWQSNLKAAMDSTTASRGDELVPTAEAATLWADVNLDTHVAALFPRVDMPTNPFQLPLQLGNVSWYPGTENTATTDTALATARQTLTAYELVAEVPWSLTLDEDAVIAMAGEVRSTLVRNAVEVIDDVLLNADTTAVNNINADTATITASDAGKGHWLVGFDGLLHLPLVDNTAQGNDHGDAPDADMYNEVRGLLGKYGVRPSELAYIVDVSTYIKSLGAEEFRTLDKLGPQATILNGQLAQVDGIPVIVSEQMAKSDDDGKVTSRRFRYSYSSVAKVGIGHYNDDSRNLSLSRRLWQITIACSYDGSGSMTNWSAGVFDEGGGYFLGKPDRTGGIILEPGTHDISLTGIVFRGTSEIERQTHEWNSQFRSGKADPVSADCDTILARHRRPPGGPPNQSTSRPSTTTSRPKI